MPLKPRIMNRSQDLFSLLETDVFKVCSYKFSRTDRCKGPFLFFLEK